MDRESASTSQILSGLALLAVDEDQIEGSGGRPVAMRMFQLMTNKRKSVEPCRCIHVA